MCQEGAADLGAGAEKSRRDVGGADKKIPLMFRGQKKNYLMNWIIKNCFKIAYNRYYIKISHILSLLGV